MSTSRFAQLRQAARNHLERLPNTSAQQLTWLRYSAADRYDNACDIINTAPINAGIILNLAVYDMLHYAFRNANRHLPRDKDLLMATHDLDPTLAALTKDFYSTVDAHKSQKIAAQTADLTIGVNGFFEWDSTLETIHQ